MKFKNIFPFREIISEILDQNHPDVNSKSPICVLMDYCRVGVSELREDGFPKQAPEVSLQCCRSAL